MANQGGDDFEALARQYWSRWGEMLRAGAAPASSGAGAGLPGAGMFQAAGFPGGGSPGTSGSGADTAMPGWNEAVAWWSKLAQGGEGLGSGSGGNLGTGFGNAFANPFGSTFGNTFGNQADAAIDRFNTQARGWYAQMQQLAAQFAGQDASATDIAEAWKRMLGGDLGNPFAEVLRGMQGPGQQGFEQWFAQAAPFLEKLQREGQAWAGIPAFGVAREHQERWQHLAQSVADYQQQSQAYQGLMTEAAQDAFKRFEQKLTERSEPGKQLESARALFDLWIDAAEDAYADIALSPRFRDAYGALVNSQMRLRAAVQREVEQMGGAFGVPTRTEVDAAHRKIVQLERELRRLRDLVMANAATSTDANQSTVESKPAAKQSGAKQSGAKQAPARKPAVRQQKAAAGKPARKPAAKKAAVKKSSARTAASRPAKKAR